MKLIKAHASILTQHSRKEGNWPKIKLLSTKWLKHQGSEQKQEVPLKSTIFTLWNSECKLLTQEIQYTANPRESERQRVNLGLSDPQKMQAKHTCCRCGAKETTFGLAKQNPPNFNDDVSASARSTSDQSHYVLKGSQRCSLFLCRAKPKLAFSAWDSFDCESDRVKGLWDLGVCENVRPRI